VAGSQQLQSLLAWSLYNAGDLNASRAALSRLRAARDAAEDRSLTVTLAITSGEWSSLATFVEQEWQARDSRTPEELLRAGQLASYVSSPRTKELVLFAATNAANNSRVLLGCYSIAIATGWEDAATFKWLESAAALSDADGPIQRWSLRDILDRQPDWQQRETRASEQLAASAIPMVAFGRLLNRSLIDLTLLPAVANLDTLDPRRRALVYSYSGARRRVSGPLPQALAIDPTALLNLSLLGVLGKLLDAVPKLLIPHSTLRWLFEERRRIDFHQPSRVADAHELRRLLDANVLQRFEPTAPVDDALTSEVGQDLASLFAEAEADWGEDRRPRFVVRSGPVHRVGSLMQEVADLGDHAARMCGCLDVVDALVRLGRLTRAEEQRARAFLKLHERDTSAATALPPGAVLYLDTVSLAYLQHLRLLSTFEGSGFTVHIAATDVAEGDRRIRFQALARRRAEVVEHIRESLARGIASGAVVVAPIREADGEDDPLDHPALDAIRIGHLADAVVVDDRFFNQHSSISHAQGTTPILTTYDLLATFQLPRDEYAECLTRMRAAGLAFVPITQDELTEYLARADVVGDRLLETAELRAIRESLLHYRMSTALQLPREAIWFDGLLRVVLEAIKAQWTPAVGTVAARARSSWLLQNLDLRGWSHRYTSQDRDLAESRFRAQIVALMTFAFDAPADLRAAYWTWLDEVLVDDIRERQPEAYDAMIQDIVRIIRFVLTDQEVVGRHE